MRVFLFWRQVRTSAFCCTYILSIPLGISGPIKLSICLSNNCIYLSFFTDKSLQTDLTTAENVFLPCIAD